MKMDLDSMIEVLQAAKRGEKIEWEVRPGVWGIAPSFNFAGYEYRIAPKQMTLVDKARALANSDIVGTDSRKMLNQLADRIEMLQNKYDGYSITDHATDELLDELKRRTSC
jgi:hypothetical protein